MDHFPTLGVPDTGDTAWMWASSALVLLMIPGLAFFYGGMVCVKGLLNMLMMSISAVGVVTVLWSLYGYSMAFGNDTANLFGDPMQYWGLNGLISSNKAADATTGAAAGNIPLAGTVPHLVFVAFQLMFAIITVALICRALADRLKFGSWLVFAALWATLVYFPVAHWVFATDGVSAANGGWIVNKLRAIDFAGGTAVRLNAATVGLMLAIVLGRRRGWPATPMRPHNLPLVMLGAGLLWFGWYGFNAGSATSANGAAASTFVTTTVATAAALLAWLLTERIRDGRATSLGAASGIKFKRGFDDSLDVVGAHPVGGLIGTLLIGFLATPQAPAAVKGLFYGGGLEQLWRQAVGAFTVLAYSAVVTAILALIVKHTIGLRVSEEELAKKKRCPASTKPNMPKPGTTLRSPPVVQCMPFTARRNEGNEADHCDRQAVHA